MERFAHLHIWVLQDESSVPSWGERERERENYFNFTAVTVNITHLYFYVFPGVQSESGKENELLYIY